MEERFRVKVRWIGRASRETTASLRGAKLVIPFDAPGTLSVTVGGRPVRSYEDLVQVAREEQEVGREFIEVLVVAPIVGG